MTWTDYGDTENGSYTYSGNVATFQFQGTAGTATIAGNSLTVAVGGSTMMTLTSGSGNNNPGGGDTAVIFSNVTANGSSSQTTTQLTLTFSQAITSLSASDITLSGVSGVSKGTLGGSGPAYTLGISGFTSGGTLSVAVAKSGYTISGSPQSTAIYYSSGSGGGGNTAVTLSNVTANGSSSQTTTQLTLTFSQAITGLSASDITLSGVSGVSKGTLGGSGPAYTLGISGFTSSGSLNVAVAKSGYTISGSPKSTAIYYSSGSGGGGTAAPGTPTSVSASAQSSSSIRISWSAPSSGGTPTWYNIWRSTSASGTYTEIDYVSSSTLSYTDTDLSASTTYYYKVDAENSTGRSSQSSYVSATTQSSGGGGGGGTTEYRIDQPLFNINTCSKSGTSLTINWTLNTSGKTPNGLYTYTQPTNIIVGVWDEDTSTWLEPSGNTFPGSRRTYTLTNYSFYATSNNQVGIRVRCTSPYNETSARITYWINLDQFFASYN